MNKMKHDDQFDAILKQGLKQALDKQRSERSLEERVIQSIHRYQEREQAFRKYRPLYVLAAACLLMIAAAPLFFGIGGMRAQSLDQGGEFTLDSSLISPSDKLVAVHDGAELKTGSSRVSLSLRENSQVIFNQNSIATLLDKDTIELHAGEAMYINTARNKKTTFILPQATVRAVGTEIHLKIADEQSEVTLLKGSAIVTHENESIVISPNDVWQFQNGAIHIHTLQSPLPVWWEPSGEKPWTEFLSAR